MSMILYLRRADNSDVDSLQTPINAGTPPILSPAKRGFFSRLFGRPKRPEPVPIPVVDPVQEFFFANPAPGDLIDFDKAWDALNAMLTGEPFGSDGPLAIFYYKGEEVGSDGGYGPARYIPAEKMKEFASALQTITDEDLVARFDPAGFEAAQLYSSYLFSEDEVEVEYIMQSVPNLRRFAERCLKTNSGALVAIY